MNTLSPGLNVTETNFDFYVRQRGTTVCGMQGVTLRGPVNTPTLCTSWEQFVRTFGGYTTDSYAAYGVRAFFDNGGEALWFNRIAHYSDITDADDCMAAASTVAIKDRTGARATGVTGSIGSNRINWQAVQPGTGGNSVSVTLVVSGVSTPLSVAVVGNDITVHLATSDQSAATSTVPQVLAKILESGAASALVTATSVETGVCAAVSKVTLSGGVTAGDSLTINASSPGEWGDALTVAIQDGTRNSATEFNVLVMLDGTVKETFRDLSLSGTASNGVASVLAKSDYVRATVTATAPFTAVMRPIAGTYTLASGADGLTSLDDTDYIGDSAARTGLAAFDNVTGLSLLCCPGISSGAVQNAMLGYAENRQDLFCIFDTPAALTEAEALEYRRGTGSYSHAAFDSSFGALYWPWLRIQDPLTRVEKVVPSSGAVAGCYVRSDKVAGVASAPAGVERGRIYGVLGVERLTQRATRDAVYPEGINVIAEFPDFGVTIWGQRTLEQLSTGVDRVNCRREMIFLETSIAQSSRFVVFRPNLPVTWRALERVVDPFLAAEKAKDAIYDYRFQCDENTNPEVSRDRNELLARVFVKLTKTAEFVEVNFVMTETSASFTEIFNS